MERVGAGGAIAETRTAQRRVAPFMLVAVVSLLLGLWAGVARIGWELPADGDLMLRHGGLMVVGFVATVIAVERAVAVQSPVAFAAPLLSAVAGVALIAALPMTVAAALATIAAAAFSLNIAVLLARHRLPPFIVALAGGICLLAGGAVWWDGGALHEVVPWWMAFLVLTIAAERLELIRFQRFTIPGALSGALVLVLLALGPALTLVEADAGARVLGGGLVIGSAWLARRDVARRTVRTEGLPRFAAAGVLTAYAWLAIAGVLLLTRGAGQGFAYDAAVHAFFIGFVFSAIIAHEPIIAPAVTGLRLPYTPLLYIPLVLLNGALVLRVGADLIEAYELRRWAGMVQALTIVLFLLLTVGSIVAGRIRNASSIETLARETTSLG